jgi:hypothetical protein
MAGPLTDRQREYLGDVAQTAAKMLAMIESVLNDAALEVPSSKPGEFVGEPGPSLPPS